MLPFPLKWLCIHALVDDTKVVLIDAAAIGDQAASFESNRFAIVTILPEKDDGSHDCVQTPVMNDYETAFRVFNQIWQTL